jgi:hypothetical protein
VDAVDAGVEEATGEIQGPVVEIKKSGTAESQEGVNMLIKQENKVAEAAEVESLKVIEVAIIEDEDGEVVDVTGELKGEDVPESQKKEGEGSPVSSKRGFILKLTYLEPVGDSENAAESVKDAVKCDSALEEKEQESLDERAHLEAEAAAVEAARKVATLDKFRAAHALLSSADKEKCQEAEQTMRTLYSLSDGAPSKPIPDTPEFTAYRASLYLIIDALDQSRDEVVEMVRPRCKGIMRGELLRLDAFKSRLVALRAKRLTLGVPAGIEWISHRAY